MNNTENFDIKYKDFKSKVKLKYNIDNVYNEYLNIYESLKKGENIHVYRVISLDNLHDLNTNNIGKHWTFNEFFDNDYHASSINMDKELRYYITLKAFINIVNVDESETVNNNLLFPLEYEITLKDNQNINIDYIEVYDSELDELKEYETLDGLLSNIYN